MTPDPEQLPTIPSNTYHPTKQLVVELEYLDAATSARSHGKHHLLVRGSAAVRLSTLPPTVSDAG